MSQSKSTNKPSSQSTDTSVKELALPTQGVNVTFYVKRGASGRYYATPDKWTDTMMDLPSGKKVEARAVMGTKKGLPSNCPNSVLIPEEVDPPTLGSLESLRVNWNSITENTILFVQS
jgi:hypothetical protein